MAYEHPSGLPGVYERASHNPDWARLLFVEGNIAQAAEMMDMQSIAERRSRRVSDRMMSDGARLDGAEIIVNAEAGTVFLTPGMVYARGDVRQTPEAELFDVTMTGEVVVGVRIVTTVVTADQDPSLTGLHPGTEAEGEPGAAREIEQAFWGWGGDGVEGDLYQVYLLKDGVPVDQTIPSNLSDMTRAIATYDRDAHGSYVVRGCRVRALGLIGGAQHFSIGEGVANILGFKRSRDFALRHIEPEEFDTLTVDAEPHTFADGGTGTAVIRFNRGPLAALTTAIITRQKTVTLIKGVAGGLDLLPDGSVSAIVSVVQSGTTYVAGTSYILNADRIDWSPTGAEPSPGSSYQVTYRYLDAVTPTATTPDTVTLTGGVTDTAVLLSYSWKLPRADILCLDQDGLPVYVKGISTVALPRAPEQPTTLLKLCEVINDWRGAPEIVNTDVRSVPFEELWVYIRKLFDYGDMIALERLKSDIDSREPVAKKGIFVDPWENDFYRDQGVPQSAAIFGGAMQLPVTPTIYNIGPASAQILDFTEEVVIRQELATSCMKINPYMNFNPLPISLAISPSVDFWTEKQTQWASPDTRVITTGVAGGTVIETGRSTSTELVRERTELIANLRQIPVAYRISGLGPGEIVTDLTFDGLNVKPGSLVADGSGVASGVFTIPGGVPAGTKRVVAKGATGRQSGVNFVGQGRIEIDVLRNVTTIRQQTIWNVSGANQGGEGGDPGVDPLAQTFMLTDARYICGADFRVCAVGNPANGLLVEIRTVENGQPTDQILAQTNFSMAGVSVGQWISPRFPLPVWLTADREYCVVIKTDDATHSLSTARLGDFDAAAQRYVAGQPYSVGVLLSSSNARTWTAHQAEDLTFRLVASRFAPVVKRVTLGTITVASMSDVLILAGVENPTGAASVVFEIMLPNGSVTRVLPDQPWPMTAFVSGEVEVSAVLTGDERVSPILYPSCAFISGRLELTGTYVSRAFSMGAAIRMSAFLKSRLPSGSTITVEIDKADDDWVAVDQHAQTVLGDGWIEREYRRTPYTATIGRLRITLTGNPGARPMLTDMRAVSI